MGERRVHDTSADRRTRAFVQAMREDIRALETMIERGMIETGLQRIGVVNERDLLRAAVDLLAQNLEWPRRRIQVPDGRRGCIRADRL